MENLTRPCSFTEKEHKLLWHALYSKRAGIMRGNPYDGWKQEIADLSALMRKIEGLDLHYR